MERMEKSKTLALAEQYLEACFALQEGARAQSELKALKIAELMRSVVMLSASEVATRANVGTNTVSSWVFRKQIFGLRAGSKGVT
jgi:DNA-binding transcriptional regulator YiaG